MNLPLNPDTVALDLGDPRAPGALALWQRRTGRHVRLPPDTEPGPALEARLRSLGMIGPPPALDALVACRSRRALLFPAERLLWHPLPLARGPGGFPYAGMALDEDEVEAWRAFNGARTLGAVRQRLGLGAEAMERLTGRLTAPEVQALQLRPGPLPARSPALDQLLAPARPAGPRLDHQRGPRGETRLARWHEECIVDGRTHFDDRETTLAHAFALPHAALDGEPYGARLARRLLAQGLMPGPEGTLLEIGPGTGELGAALRAALPAPPRGLRLDLSPALLATQAARCPDTVGLQGSATAIPLPPDSVDLVICNEVIADLEASADPGGFSVRPEPGQALFNTGAWRMMGELARVLKPGGAFFVSEFGAEREHPTETTQLDHPEVSIHFGQLAEVARAAGLAVALHPLADWMGFDLDTRWLSRGSHEALRARARAQGLHLEARAWTAATQPLPWPVEGLHEVSLREPGPGPLPARFMALVGRKR